MSLVCGESPGLRGRPHTQAARRKTQQNLLQHEPNVPNAKLKSAGRLDTTGRRYRVPPGPGVAGPLRAGRWRRSAHGAYRLEPGSGRPSWNRGTSRDRRPGRRPAGETSGPPPSSSPSEATASHVSRSAPPGNHHCLRGAMSPDVTPRNQRAAALRHEKGAVL